MHLVHTLSAHMRAGNRKMIQEVWKRQRDAPRRALLHPPTSWNCKPDNDKPVKEKIKVIKVIKVKIKVRCMYIMVYIDLPDS